MTSIFEAFLIADFLDVVDSLQKKVGIEMKIVYKGMKCSLISKNFVAYLFVQHIMWFV